MNARIKSAILAQYHYDVVDYLHIDTSFNDSTFKYILVPLWCSGFKYRDKIYNYFVNGRTGKAGGKTPISVWKVALTVVIIAAVIVGAYFIPVLFSFFSTDFFTIFTIILFIMPSFLGL